MEFMYGSRKRFKIIIVKIIKYMNYKGNLLMNEKIKIFLDNKIETNKMIAIAKLKTKFNLSSDRAKKEYNQWRKEYFKNYNL